MSLAGEVTEHIVPFFYGTGRNGKGTFLDTIAKILGSYAVIIPISMLLVQRFPAHPTEIAQLAGARFALGGEVNADAQFDEARFKMLSGGDRLTGRFLCKDFFSFDPTHQLWLVGNHLPAVTHGGPAFWARTARVDHPHAMPEHLQNKKLRQEMPDLHGPAVLAWAITGAVRYGTEGIVQPETVVAATAAYQHDQDSVAQFVDEECTVGGGALVRVAISLFRERYKRWCDLNDLTPVNAKRLGMELYSRHSVQKGLEDRQRSYANIRLNDMPHGYIPGPLDGPGE
jgi:putative DNA primase/helicase